MITGLTYLLSSLSFAIVMALASTKGHEELGQGVSVFRYKRGLINVLTGIIAVPPVLMLGVYVVTKPHPTGVSLVSISAAGVAGAIGLYLVVRWVEAYFVEVHDSYIVIHTLRETSKFDYTQLADCVLRHGAKASRSILFQPVDPKSKPALVNDTLSDFDEFVDLVDKGLKRAGLKMRFRDKWGRYSD